MIRDGKSGCPVRRQASSPAFTLLEAIVATSIMSLIFVSAWGLLTESIQAMQLNQSVSDLDFSVNRILDRLWQELRDSGSGFPDDPSAVETICHNGVTKTVPVATAQAHFASHPGDSPGTCGGSPAVTQVVDYVISHPFDETTVQSSVVFQTLASDSGSRGWSTPIRYSLDNSGRLIRTQDGVDTVFAEGVTALTVRRTQGEHKITVEITVDRQGPRSGEVLSRNVETMVAFRNRGD